MSKRFIKGKRSAVANEAKKQRRAERHALDHALRGGWRYHAGYRRSLIDRTIAVARKRGPEAEAAA